METKRSKFYVGQIIRHQRYQYRGVIYDVDPHFMLPEEWYEQVAHAKPPKHEPWYKVLVDGSEEEAYVAERNLSAGDCEPIEHSALDVVFQRFDEGRYVPRHPLN